MKAGLFHQPKNTMPRIDRIWAVLSVDEADGNEGVVAAPTLTGMLMPLIAADPARLKDIMPLARNIATATGRRLRLVKFTMREEVEEISP